MPGEVPRLTLSDVAAAAGVSKATVSKALNGRDDVSAATRRRVLETVEVLGYRPLNGIAAREARRSVAVVFDLPAAPYILSLLHGVLSSADEKGIGLLTCLAPPLGTRRDRVVARSWVSQQRAAGVIGVIGLTLPEPDAMVDAARDADLPFVMIDPVDTLHERLVSVGSSNWAGARTATDHLIALGHRRIAWVGGPEASGAARDRFYGYQAALDAAGVPLDPALVRSGRFGTATGERAARELLLLPEPPTAVMAASDEIAIGFMATAHGMGVRVPDDLSITGFDDTPQAAWTSPALTTVRQHLDGMGRLAVETVTAMAVGRRPPSRHLELATSLSVRGTTGPAPVLDPAGRWSGSTPSALEPVPVPLAEPEPAPVSA